MQAALHAPADTTDDSKADPVLPASTSDRVVWTQEQADKIRKALARNSVIRTPTLIHTAPNYYHEMTAFNGYG